MPLRRADGKAVDVEPTPREQARHAHERARPVLDEDGQRVLHVVTGSSAGYSSTSSAAAPAGIIGKQCSRGSTRASITHVRPEASADCSALSNSSSFSAVKPRPPYARASAA